MSASSFNVSKILFTLLISFSLKSAAQNIAISTIAPTFGRIGQVCTISGAGFGSNKSSVKVYIGNIAASVISVSPNQIQINTPYGMGRAKVKVLVNGRKAINDVFFNYKLPVPAKFAPSNDANKSYSITSVTPPNELIKVDLNGDGFVDYISRETQIACLVYDTTLKRHIRYTIDRQTTTYLSSIIAEDMNGDGLLDVVAYFSDPSAKKILIYYNRFNENFKQLFSNPQLIEIGGQMILYDANSDGLTDIIDANPSANKMYILLNTLPSYTFKINVALTITIPTVTSISFIDLNNDTKPDLLLQRADSSFFRINNSLSNSSISNNSFSSLSYLNIPIGSNFQDMDEDGDLDIIFLSNYSTNLRLNNSSTTNIQYGPEIRLISDNSSQRLSLSDLNGDGAPDVIIEYPPQGFRRGAIYENTFSSSTVYDSTTFLNKKEFSYLADLAFNVYDMDNDGAAELGYINSYQVATFARYDTLSYKPPIIETPLKHKSWISGQNITLKVNSSFKPDLGNSYVLEISDATGDFSSPILTQSINTDSSKCTFIISVPSVSIGANTYKLRVTTLSPFNSSILFDSLLIVPQRPSPQSVSNRGFGQAGHEMSIYGTGFNNFENILYVGGRKAKIVSVQPQEIKFIAPFGATSDFITFYSCGVSKKFDIRFNYSFPGTKVLNQNLFTSGEIIQGNIYNDVNTAADLNDDGLLDIPGSTYPYNATLPPYGKPIFQQGSKTPIRIAPGNTPDMDGDGYADLLIATSGAITTGIFNINSNGKLWSYSAAGYSSLYSEDFNNDGLFDVITINNSGGAIYINKTQIGDDSVTFHPPLNIFLPTRPSEATIFDIDNDGKKDIIFSYSSSKELSFVRNTTNGTTSFTAPTHVNFNVTFFRCLKYTDLNNDGYQDIIATSYDQFYSTSIFIFINNGANATSLANTFLSPLVLNTGLRVYCNSTHFVDWNGDNKIDIIANNQILTSDSLIIYYNNHSTGNFTLNNLQRLKIIGKGLTSIPLDIDYDGTFDWILENTVKLNLSHRFKVIKYNFPILGVDSFKISYCIDTAVQINRNIAFQISDINGNFNNSILTQNKSFSNQFDSFTVAIPQNFNISPTSNYKARFVYLSTGIASDTISLKVRPSSINFNATLTKNNATVGDTLLITGIGLSDVHTVFFGPVSGRITHKSQNQLKVIVPLGAVSTNIQLIKQSLSYTIPNKLIVGYVKRNSTLQYFESLTAVTYGQTNQFKRNVNLSDFNGDGFTDVVYSFNNSIIIGLNDGDKQTALILNLITNFNSSNVNIRSICPADLDLDGDYDLIVSTSDYVCFIENKTQNTQLQFAPPTTILFEPNIDNVFVGHFNADCKMDILVAYTMNNDYYFQCYQNESSASSTIFSYSPPLIYYNANMRFEVIDLDNNGTLDLLMNNIINPTNTIYVALSQKNSEVAFNTFTITTPKPVSLVMAEDLNNDALNEIIFKAENSPSGVGIYIGKNTTNGFSNSGFPAFTCIDSSYNNNAGQNFSITDFDFDGIKDIICGNIFFRGKNAAPVSFAANYHYPKNTGGTMNPSRMLYTDFNNDRKTDCYDLESNLIYLNTLKTINLESPRQMFCAGSNANITFSCPQLIFNPTNKFTLILSDSTGDFERNTIALDTILGSNADTFRFTLPPNLNPNNVYQLKVISSDPVVESENTVNLPLSYCLSPIQLIPDYAKIGDQITIKGGVFQARTEDIIVYFNKARAQIVKKTDTTLTVLVPPHATYGHVSVSIKDYMVTSNLPFRVAFNSTSKFDSTCMSVERPKGASAYISDKEVDIDGDGYVEFGYKTYNYNQTLDTVIFNDTYLASEYETSQYPNSTVDMSGDGIPDFIEASNYTQCAGTIGSYYEFKSKSYDMKYGYPKKGISNITYALINSICYLAQPMITFGDYNLDGKNEVIAAQPFVNSPMVMIRRYSPPVSPFSHSTTPTLLTFPKYYSNTNYSEKVPLCSGDFNLDGLLDISTYKALWINNTQNDNTGNIMNGFSKVVDYNNVGQSSAMLAADLNQDSRVDFAIVEIDGRVRLYQNQSTPNNLSIIQDKFIINLKGSSVSTKVHAEDMNGDGKVDLIIDNISGTKSIYIYKNISTPQHIIFDTINPIKISGIISNVAHKYYDFNNDGRIDIIGFTNSKNLVLIKNQFPSLQVKYPKNIYCFNDSLELELNALDYIFNSNNQFRLELSDSSGSFSSPINLINFNQYGRFFRVPFPANIPPGKNYKIRLISTNPADTSSTPQFGFEIRPNYTTPVISALGGALQKCTGDSITLVYQNNQPGTTYSWIKNNSILPITDTFYKVSQTASYYLVSIKDNCSQKSNILSLVFYPNPVSNINHLINDKICTGDSIGLRADSVISGRYNWYKNNLILPDTTTTIFIKDSALYKLKVVDMNGCSSFSNNLKVFQVNKPVPSIGLSKSSPICKSDSIKISIANSNISQYKWRLNSIELSDTLNYLTVKQTGHWGVQIKDNNKCLSKWADTFLVVNSEPITPQYTLNSTGICLGDTVTISLNNPLKYRIKWFKNQQLLPQDTIETILITSSGSYSYELTDSNKCSSKSADTTVVLRNLPTLSLISSNGDSLCQKDSTTLIVNSNDTVTYQWFKNNTLLASETNKELIVRDQASYKVIVTSSYGCKQESENKQIIIHPLPNGVLSKSILNSYLCKGDSIKLSLASSGNYQHNWTRNYKNLDNNDSQLYVKDSGDYMVILLDSNGCQSYTNTIALSVREKPNALLVATKTSFCIGDSALLVGSQPSEGANLWLSNDSLVLTNSRLLYAKSGATYQIMTDSGGCTAFSNKITLQILPSPNFNFNSSNSLTFCEGDSVLLTVSTASNNHIKWFESGIHKVSDTLNTFTAKKSGMVQLELTNPLGCKSTLDTPTVMLPKPLTPFITKEQQELVSSINLGNQWLFNSILIQGATNNRLTPQQIGSYQVYVTNSNGCKSDTSLPFLFNSVRMINVNTNNINLFPIPANDIIYLTSDLEIEQVEVFDINGKIVMTEHLNCKNCSLQVLGLENGIYLAKIWRSNKDWVIKKLIISHL